MRRETQNILLVLVGGALLKISLNGTYLQYVKPSHRYWLIGGGLVMVLLAGISIARELFARAPHEHDDGDHEGHDHSARSAWLLILPVLTIFLIAPPALGADSVRADASNRAATTLSSGADDRMLFSPLPAGDPLPVKLSDFAARAAWDSGNSLDNRRVRLTGFVVVDGQNTYLARLSITCCAADALPVRVRLDGPRTTGYQNDTWLNVTGTLRPGSATEDDDYVPTLSATELTKIHQPEDPYEH
ncbi:TIGR03943 family putative permease subunit [Actinokineospora enzanensis]|uniref:TIGR03943 family putative permease subunit n=1 Tax=Actinokineospora enzanensis TaxID=155975 RepID=UPI000361ED9B|nr:TIGR03943 family protein [Actinokineospora enzanensis]